MTNGDRLPLLLFQEPVPATKPTGGFGRPKFNKRSRQEVAGYLDPKLSRLDQALESERIRIQANAAGIEPEMALVIELATEPSNFAAAARAIGLEWLAEDEIDIDPSDEIHRLNPKGQRQDKPYQGRLFLTMTNRRALDELLSRWRKWRDQPEAGWPYGETAWRDIFPLIVDIRPWGIEDRLQETGLLEDLAERIEADEESIPFEAELWYRQTAERRALAEGEVGRLLRELGGSVTTRFQLKDIRYHALLGEIPANAVSRLLTLDPNIELLRCNDVWLLRPVGQCAAPLILTPEVGEAAVSPADLPDPALPSIVAILDGIPLAGHELLRDRLIVDDPDGFEADAPAEQRVHGTSMASLILHGEIEAMEDPLPRRIYCRPIMVPQVTARNAEEHVPDGVLPVDLIHRAVRRLFEGEGETDAQAPETRIINLSVGDPARPFLHGLSPWARLLDWLSYQYGVLFVVSAGNHVDTIDLDIPKDSWSITDAETRDAEILRALKANARQRRILSPAESINALSVGAAHADACPQGPRASYHCDPFKIQSLASPISANGLGFLQALKPEILMPGGRQIYEEPVGTGVPHTRLVPLQNWGPPGQKTAVPGTVPGELDKTLWFRGTSNAAALATRVGAQLFEMLEDLRTQSDGAGLPPRYDALLIKALLVHGASWGEAGKRMRDLFKQEVGGRKVKDLVGRFLGYGLIDRERVLGCTERRATLLGVGTLAKGEAHAFTLPLPADLSGHSSLRRVTITLAWISPIAPSQQRYRKAHLWFDSDASDLIGVGRGKNAYDHNLVKRGTVQHEVFEGEKARAFADGDAVRIQVNCREDAPGLDDPVDYGIVVSLEVAEEVPVAVYQQIRQKLRPTVPITP
jgi:hypothetical protein